MSDRGWICPRCDAVNAPVVLKCACSPKAAAAAPGLLEKFAELAEEMKRERRERPVYVPYPVPVPRYPAYPSWPYTYTSDRADWTYRPTITMGIDNVYAGCGGGTLCLGAPSAEGTCRVTTADDYEVKLT